MANPSSVHGRLRSALNGSGSRYLSHAVLGLWIVLGALVATAAEGAGQTFYVRATAGSDANDGLSPSSAWRTLKRLGGMLRAGDTAYVGPGLYREQLFVQSSGREDARITLVGDGSGQRTGDPPGVVMIAGSDPIAGDRFVAAESPGVYRTARSTEPVFGVVEMDGPQLRYADARELAARARGVEGSPSPLELVAREPSSFLYDADARSLTLHTSDGRPPSEHEIELIRRSNGITVTGKPYVSVVGFTVRHARGAGIHFTNGSSHAVASDNSVYGSWQGIQLRASPNARLSRNVVFRNGNSGIYFLLRSTGGFAVDNVAYENDQGIRWGTGSNAGLGTGNTVFDNHDAGIAIENVTGLHLADNVLAGNGGAQLRVRQARYRSEGNCFETAAPAQQTAWFFPDAEGHPSLARYQEARWQDWSSREGECGPRPAKLDVQQLHAGSGG